MSSLEHSKSRPAELENAQEPLGPRSRLTEGTASAHQAAEKLLSCYTCGTF